jgi:ATP-dependent helicase/nuclease subunit A
MANLTEQQHQAVYNNGGKLLVSAAAGSGKTMVLVERLMRYILDPVNPANIDDFLIITYTKAAASELREKIGKRLNQLLVEDAGNRHLQNQLQRLYLAKISTVHGFCTDILRENAYKLNISTDFRVAEEDECALLQETVLAQLLEDAYNGIGTEAEFRTVVDTQGFGRDDRKLPQIILSVYQSSRCHLDPDWWLEKCIEESQITDLIDAGETVWGKYLIEDLHACLDLYIPAIKRCAQEAGMSVGMEKASILLNTTCQQLAILRDCNTWEEIHNHLILQFGTMTFGKSADPDIKERIKAVRDGCKEMLLKKQMVFTYDNDQVIGELKSCAPVVKGLVELVRKFSISFEQRKQAKRIMDFADLEHKALDLLLGKNRTGITAAANEIGQRFREVMVDEYQDSNAVQDAIFNALTLKRQNCFMVGDVKQSIYQFRLADPGIFLEKYNHYLPADEALQGQGRKVLLSKNFRSSNGVISGINDVFAQCMSPTVGGLTYGDDEKLNGDDNKSELPDPEVEFYAIEVKEDTYAEEAAFVAKRVHQLLDEGALVRGEDGLRPVVPEDIAIILRSPGSVGAEFASALEENGISCCFGNEQDVLQSEEVQFLRSLLQVIDNPLQDIPLVAVMMSRVFAFTADEMASIRKDDTFSPVYELLKRSQEPKVRAFYEILMSLRKKARMCSISELIEHILILTRMDSIFFASKGNTGTIAAFQQLVSGAEQSGHRDVRSFLAYFEGLAERGLPSSTNNRTEGMVTILSIHKSKGLEYPVVFLCGLSKGFNREDLKEQVLCDKRLGLGVTYVDSAIRVRYPTIAKRAIMLKKSADSLSEELRVLYVAMTRAKDRLIMTYASRYLENTLLKCARRIDYAGNQLIASDASSMGDWVLQTAMQRIEAGELFAVGDRPLALKTDCPAWKISVIKDVSPDCSGETKQDAIPKGTNRDSYLKYKEALSYVYPYEKATSFPSKQTATQLKGREKDQEVEEDTVQTRRVRPWRKPSFIQKGKDSLAAGTATHKALQFLSFNSPPTAEELDAGLDTLCASGLLTNEELTLIDRKSIYAFLHSPLGQQLCASSRVVKEFKFSILMPADAFEDGLSEDNVLLQGVVDCAILDDDGITVIDFKTDVVNDESVRMVADGYRGQILAYAEALSKIYQLPIKRAVLYFLRIGCTMDVN